MQSTVTESLPRRLIYYLARIYSDQLGEGEKYGDLLPAICVCLLGQTMFRGHPEVHSRFRLFSPERQLEFSDQLEIHLLELPKYQGRFDDLGRASSIEKWVCFLRHAAELELSEIRQWFQEPAFTEAGAVLEMISQTPEERLRYESRVKALRDQLSNLDDAERRGMAAGLAQGREEGLAEGRELGRRQGQNEGRWIGKVQTLQEMDGERVSAVEEFATWDLARLQAYAADLQTRLSQRKA